MTNWNCGLGKVCRAPLFSNDGRLVFICDGACIVILSSASGVTVRILAGHAGAVTGVALHPTAPHILLSSSIDGTLRYWDFASGAALGCLRLGAPIVRIGAGKLNAACDGGARVYCILALPSRERSDALTVEGAYADGDADGDNEGMTISTVAAAEKVKTSSIHDSAASVARSVVASSYPLGEEPACLQVRPPPETLALTVDSMGRPRAPPLSQLIELSLSSDGDASRDTNAASNATILYEKEGFVTGLDVRVFSQGSQGEKPDVTVAISIRQIIGIFRISGSGRSTTEFRASALLSSLSLHPLLPFVTVGELRGRLLSVFLPTALGATHILTPSSSSSQPSAVTLATDAVVSDAHWHAHAPWAGVYVSDGSFFISGGEEATLVKWQLGGSGSGGGAPRRDRRHMDFLPRLSARVRALSVCAPIAGSAGGGGAARELPPLVITAVLADNSIVAVNGLDWTPLWRRARSATAGLPATLSSGAAAASARAATRARELEANAAAATGNLTASGAAQVNAPTSLAFPNGFLPSVFLSASRTLSRGVVLDPRARVLVAAGYPGRASLEWVDPSTGSSVGVLDVVISNAVSRADAEPPPPARVSHAAFSADGSTLVTVDVVAASASIADAKEDEGAHSATLRFWSWSPTVIGGGGGGGGNEGSNSGARGAGRWVLVARVDDPHAGRNVTALEISPDSGGGGGGIMVVTAGTDATFKTWIGITPRISTSSTTAAAATTTTTATTSTAAVDDNDKTSNNQVESSGNRRERRIAAKALAATAAALGPGISTVALPPSSIPTPTAITPPARVWSCTAVGLWHGNAASAVTFSGDGSLLVLSFGRMLTLWAPRSLALRATLPFPALRASDNEPNIDSIGFAGLSQFLIAASRSHGIAVFDVTSSTLVWSISSRLLSPLAFDRVGLACTTRFAVAATVKGAHIICVWDATAPAGTAPLALFAPESPRDAACISAGVNDASLDGAPPLPRALRDAYPYAIAFAPAAAAAPRVRSGTSVALANSLAVIGPLGNTVLLPLPSLRAASMDEVGVVETAAAAAAASEGTSSSRSIVPSAISSSMSGLIAPSTLNSSISLIHIPSANAPQALKTLIDTLGSAAGVPSTRYVIDSLFPILLPTSSTPSSILESSSSSSIIRGGNDSLSGSNDVLIARNARALAAPLGNEWTLSSAVSNALRPTSDFDDEIQSGGGDFITSRSSNNASSYESSLSAAWATTNQSTTTQMTSPTQQQQQQNNVSRGGAGATPASGGGSGKRARIL